jgi:hypothetical protein
MAKVLILGGGFAGVVAAERLAEQLGDEHQITLVSRSRQFVFYPALVRLAFGKAEPADVSFDLRHTLLNRRINFIEAEVAYIDPSERNVTIAHGQVEGKLAYDYLVFALGRRLATERITGFYEHAHHLLNVDKAISFGKAAKKFQEGSAVFGQCSGARLPVPVYESAFALARQRRCTQASARRTSNRIPAQPHYRITDAQLSHDEKWRSNQLRSPDAGAAVSRLFGSFTPRDHKRRRLHQRGFDDACCRYGADICRWRLHKLRRSQDGPHGHTPGRDCGD